MDNSGYIFNPNQWNPPSSQTGGLDATTLAELDSRYLNIGESMISGDISNLRVTNVSITDTGKIYFDKDNTEQTTAFVPSNVTAQINAFLTSDNNFTGITSYRNFNLKDSLGNTTQLIQDSNILKLTNQVNLGEIQLITKNSGGVNNILKLDANGNVSGIKLLSSTQNNTNTILLQGTNKFYKDAVGDLNIENLSSNSIKLTTLGSTASNTMTYDNLGNLSGLNQINSNDVMTSNYKFTGKNAKIYHAGVDMICDNKATGGTFQIWNYENLDTKRTLMIDQFINVGGINDLRCNSKFYIGKSEISSGTQDLIIDNTVRGGNIILKNYDDTGLLKQITMDKNMNISGINDLYVQRIFLNNSLQDFAKYNNTSTQTQMISYTSGSTTQTNILSSTNNGFIFMPNSNSDGVYNNVTKLGDNVIVSSNSSRGSSGTPLTLTTWSTSQACGIRITQNETEIYKPKLKNDLVFNDNTSQTTAMTESMVIALINARLTASSSSVPVGTILAYTSTTDPTGYFICDGREVSIASYPDLYNVIGTKYGSPTSATTFVIPNCRGAFLKGIGINSTWTYNNTIALGEMQQANVGYHGHQFSARGNVNASVGTGSTVINAPATNTSVNYTSTSYNLNTKTALGNETRPNSVGVSYIIKF